MPPKNPIPSLTSAGKKRSSSKTSGANLLAAAAAGVSRSPSVRRSVGAGVKVAKEAAKKGRKATSSEKKKLSPLAKRAEALAEERLSATQRMSSPRKSAGKKPSAKKRSPKKTASPRRAASPRKAKSPSKKAKRAPTEYNKFVKREGPAIRARLAREGRLAKADLNKEVFRQVGAMWRSKSGYHRGDTVQIMRELARDMGIEGRSKMNSTQLHKAVYGASPKRGSPKRASPKKAKKPAAH